MDSVATNAGDLTAGRTGVQTLDRVVRVLETVAALDGCSLADLVRETGLPRPTVYRLATVCEQHGLLARDRDGRFQLGGRLVGWGAQAAGSSRLVDAARPVLARLAATTGESTQLYVREGTHRICVAVHERPSGLRDTVPLGAVMPLTKGSGGKVLLAWAPDRDAFDVLPAVLAGVREQGFAQSIGEREAGVASVSAPVCAPDGRVLAAISVSGPAERMDAAAIRRFTSAVLDAAALVARGVTSE